MRTMASPRRTALWRLRNQLEHLVTDALRNGATSTDVLRISGIAIDAAAKAVPRKISFMSGEELRLKVARCEARNQRRAARKAARRAERAAGAVAA